MTVFAAFAVGVFIGLIVGFVIGLVNGAGRPF